MMSDVFLLTGQSDWYILCPFFNPDVNKHDVAHPDFGTFPPACDTWYKCRIVYSSGSQTVIWEMLKKCSLGGYYDIRTYSCIQYYFIAIITYKHMKVKTAG